MACECLFYSTYHTQCTVEEVASLLDLIQALTNGTQEAGGVGCGLSPLDPIRNVPDPFVLSWDSQLGGGSSTPSLQFHTNPAATSSTPQQTKLDKDPQEWYQELMDSLWSVRGLSQATVTTSHVDYTGHTLYNASKMESSSPADASGGGGGVGTNVSCGGKPQLLKCVSSLVLSVLCALDANAVLLVRSSPNAFGSGIALMKNTLLGEDSSKIADLMMPITSRLDPNLDQSTQWKRQDIVGFLAAAYALLLQPHISTSSALSPSNIMTAEAASSAVHKHLKSLHRSCLEFPAFAKSFSFVRMSLIPSLGAPSMKPSSANLDTDYAFYLSVLSNFTSQYLDSICSLGELPYSRAKWLQDELQDLQMRQVQEEKRRQMHGWSGHTYQEVEVPKEVNVLNRPDCLDDIIALAVFMCSVYPQCAGQFWSLSENLVELKPSRIVKKLEQLQTKDTSLLPTYLTFLSTIALCDSPCEGKSNGADAV